MNSSTNSIPINRGIEGKCIWRQLAGAECNYEHVLPCVGQYEYFNSRYMEIMEHNRQLLLHKKVKN